jgi:5-methylcytosine-specific restriction endonuclease McrA
MIALALFGLLVLVAIVAELAARVTHPVAPVSWLQPAPVRSRAIPSDVRQAVYARDGRVCYWCGRSVDASSASWEARPHLDHLVPYSRGGTSSAANLVVACALCNVSRGARPRPSDGAIAYGRRIAAQERDALEPVA